MQQQTRQSIEDYPLQDGQGAWQTCLHQLVLGYLVHHGYCNTALTFASSTSQTIQEDTASIKNRQSKPFILLAYSQQCNLLGIQACLLSGRVSEALHLVRLAYPGLLEANKELLFKLKCRQFVEMIGGCDKIIIETPRLSCHSELGSSSDGTPPRDVATPPSPHNESSSSVFDNGEVFYTVITITLMHNNNK